MKITINNRKIHNQLINRNDKYLMIPVTVELGNNKLKTEFLIFQSMPSVEELQEELSKNNEYIIYLIDGSFDIHILRVDKEIVEVIIKPFESERKYKELIPYDELLDVFARFWSEFEELTSVNL